MVFAVPTPWREHHNREGGPKLPWNTAAEAEAHARSFNDGQHVYQCSRCGRWHVGLFRNRLGWMTETLMLDIELGGRVVANLRHETLHPFGAINERVRAAERQRAIRYPVAVPNRRWHPVQCP